MIMAKVSIYFRDERQDWQSINLSYDPLIYTKSKQQMIIEIACDFAIYGSDLMSRGIDKFLSDENVREVRFDLTSQGRYFFIIRREED